MSPRRIVAPAAFAARVAENACSSDSTAHGPAMIVNESRPTGVVPTFTVVVSGCRSSATILYGLPTWITWSTPGICLNGIVWNRAVSPTSPMIVCTVPRETKASPSAARTRSATASMSASVASAFITTTMSSSVPWDRGPPRDEKTPGPARGRCLFRTTGDYAGSRPS